MRGLWAGLLVSAAVLLWSAGVAGLVRFGIARPPPVREASGFVITPHGMFVIKPSLEGGGEIETPRRIPGLLEDRNPAWKI